jgi:Tfp pilus assembly protein PilN
MRINTNFLAPRRDLATISIRAVAAMAVALLGGAVVLGFQAVDAFDETAELSSRVLEAGERASASSASVLPDHDRLNAARTRVRQMNTVFETHGRTTAWILADLERHLPDDAYLWALQHRADTGEASLSVVAAKPKSLTVFLRALETDSAFEEVALVRQTAQAGEGQGARYDIRWKERP